MINVIVFASVYMSGCNDFGKLGQNSTKTFTTAFNKDEHFFAGKIRKIALGTSHGLYLNSQNQIFSWGDNRYNQAGSPTTVQYYPQHLPFFDDKNASDISTGWVHSVVLTTNGTVFGWGNNKLGQIRTDQFNNNPVIIDQDAQIKQILTGDFYTIIVKQDSFDVYGLIHKCMASLTLKNENKMTYKYNTEWIFAGPSSVIFRANNQTYALGDNENAQFCTDSATCFIQPTKLDFDYEKVSLSSNHNVYIDKNKVFSCGSNASGQLVNIEEANAIQVQATLKGSIVLQKSGLLIYGEDTMGELGSQQKNYLHYKLQLGAVINHVYSNQDYTFLYGQEKATWKIVGISILVGIIVVVILVFGWILYSCKKQQKTTKKEEMIKLVDIRAQA
ncbi:LPXTG-motif_cell wall anchor domain [Hexamita inflata]|uniref:LPXTG-motif cell wall anchor domain n=1 Tax=Hexamita inflata TaxID=28002 RepID=A0AA86P1B2_9EUKA|nr:LPXTG-motif cell wall anchor domain [Hexamita inflata]